MKAITVAIAISFTWISVLSHGEENPSARKADSIEILVQRTKLNGDRLNSVRSILASYPEDEFGGTVSINYGSIESAKLRILSIRTYGRYKSKDVPWIVFELVDPSIQVIGEKNDKPVTNSITLFEVQSPYEGPGEYLIYETDTEKLVVEIKSKAEQVSAR